MAALAPPLASRKIRGADGRIYRVETRKIARRVPAVSPAGVVDAAVRAALPAGVEWARLEERHCNALPGALIAVDRAEGLLHLVTMPGRPQGRGTLAQARISPELHAAVERIAGEDYPGQVRGTAAVFRDALAAWVRLPREVRERERAAG